MTATAPTAPATTAQETTVSAEVLQQYREEAIGLKHDEDFMLKQKYGMVAPQLTLSETNLIRREERNGRR